VPQSLILAYALSFLVSVFQAIYTPAASLYAYSLGYGEADVGYILGIANFVYVPGALASSRLAGRAGERRTVLLSLVLLSLAMALTPRVRGFWELAAVAGMVFLSMGLFWPAVESVISGPSGGRVSTFSFSWSSGALLGALVTSQALRLGASTLFTSFSLVSAAAAISAAGVPSARRSTSESSDNFSLLEFWPSWVLCLSYSVSAGGVFVFYPLLVERRWMPLEYISLAAASMMLARTLTFFSFDRVPQELRRVLVGALALTGSFFLLTSAEYATVALAAAATGFGQGIVYAIALSEVFSRGGGATRYTSVFEAMIGLGYSLGPVAGAALSSAAGVEPMLASSVLAFALALATRLGRRGL
jgi:Major Facilitator Superfamily.